MFTKIVFILPVYFAISVVGYNFYSYDYNGTEAADTSNDTDVDVSNNTDVDVSNVTDVDIVDIEENVTEPTTGIRAGYRYHPEIQGWLKLHNDTADWQTARINCHDEDAVLAAPLNDAFHTILMSMFTIGYNGSYEASRRLPSSAMYVGIHAEYPEGIYKYHNGKPVLAQDSVEIQKLDKCALYTANQTAVSWVNCQLRFPYVCYAPAEAVCGDEDYKLDDRTGQCYKFHARSQPWNDAHRTCLDEGGHLAIPNSQVEADVLVELFEKYPFEKLYDTNIHWGVMAVGFYYWKEADIFITIHGQTLEEAGYDKWSYGNPSSRGKNMALGGGMFRSGLLDDVDKSYKVPFICEKTPKLIQLE